MKSFTTRTPARGFQRWQTADGWGRRHAVIMRRTRLVTLRTRSRPKSPLRVRPQGFAEKFARLALIDRGRPHRRPWT